MFSRLLALRTGSHIWSAADGLIILMCCIYFICPDLSRSQSSVGGLFCWSGSRVSAHTRSRSYTGSSAELKITKLLNYTDWYRILFDINLPKHADCRICFCNSIMARMRIRIERAKWLPATTQPPHAHTHMHTHTYTHSHMREAECVF